MILYSQERSIKRDFNIRHLSFVHLFRQRPSKGSIPTPSRYQEMIKKELFILQEHGYSLWCGLNSFKLYRSQNNIQQVAKNRNNISDRSFHCSSIPSGEQLSVAPWNSRCTDWKFYTWFHLNSTNGYIIAPFHHFPSLGDIKGSSSRKKE